LCKYCTGAMTSGLVETVLSFTTIGSLIVAFYMWWKKQQLQQQIDDKYNRLSQTDVVAENANLLNLTAERDEAQRNYSQMVEEMQECKTQCANTLEKELEKHQETERNLTEKINTLTQLLNGEHVSVNVVNADQMPQLNEQLLAKTQEYESAEKDLNKKTSECDKKMLACEQKYTRLYKPFWKLLCILRSVHQNESVLPTHVDSMVQYVNGYFHFDIAEMQDDDELRQHIAQKLSTLDYLDAD